LATKRRGSAKNEMTGTPRYKKDLGRRSVGVGKTLCQSVSRKKVLKAREQRVKTDPVT